jgi:hypothetical protein
VHADGREAGTEGDAAQRSSSAATGTPEEMSLFGAAGYAAVPLSFDHTPDREEEGARIVRLGGRVEKWDLHDTGVERVWLSDARVPGLAMTRSFGDSIVKEIGVIAVPEVYAVPLCAADRFVILASDGVFDFITTPEVVAIVARMRDSATPQEAAEEVVKIACARWMDDDVDIDDISCAVVYLDVVQPAARRPAEPVHVPVPLAALRQQSLAAAASRPPAPAASGGAENGTGPDGPAVNGGGGGLDDETMTDADDESTLAAGSLDDETPRPLQLSSNLQPLVPATVDPSPIYS